MYRVNILGKVGYFKDEETACNFIISQFSKNDFDIILKDFRCGVSAIKEDYFSLVRYNVKRLIGRSKMIFKNNVGVKVANYFMNFRYKLKASTKNSVEENLKDIKSIKKITHKIITLGNTNNIRLGSFFTFASLTAGGQKIGNFMPIVAKTIYEKYCPEKNANILDISAGFGGRLVGAMSSKYHYRYTGVDPSTEAIEGLNKLIHFLKVEDRAKVIKLPFEDSDKELEDDSFDLCFTSPPYFQKEIYSDEETQSCNRYKGIEEWRKGFLEGSFEIVFRKLRKEKYMLINIADVKIRGEVYPLEELTIDTAKKVGFNYRGFKIMEMARMPGIRKRFKNEKIFIFQKS